MTLTHVASFSQNYILHCMNSCLFYILGPDSDCGILPRSLNVIFNSIEGRNYSQNNIKPHRCVDFIRLTKEQQDEEATNKRNLLRRCKDVNHFYIYILF